MSQGTNLQWPWDLVAGLGGNSPEDAELMDELMITIDPRQFGRQALQFLFECEQPWEEVARWRPAAGDSGSGGKGGGQ